MFFEVDDGGRKQLSVLPRVHALLEVLLGVEESVEQITVLAVLLGFEVKGVEEFEHAFGELSDLDVGWALLDFALNDSNFHVLLSQQLFLLDDLVVLAFVLSLNLAQDSSMLVLLNLLFPFLHLDNMK